MTKLVKQARETPEPWRIPLADEQIGIGCQILKAKGKVQLMTFCKTIGEQVQPKVAETDHLITFLFAQRAPNPDILNGRLLFGIINV